MAESTPTGTTGYYLRSAAKKQQTPVIQTPDSTKRGKKSNLKENEVAQPRLNEIEELNRGKEEEINGLKRENEELKIRLKEEILRNTQLQRDNERNTQIQVELEALKIELIDDQAMIRNLKSLNDQLKLQLKKLEEESNTREDEMERLRCDKMKLKEEQLKAKCDYEARIGDLDKEIERLSLNNKSLDRDVSSLDNNLQHKCIKLDETLKDKALLNSEIEFLRSKLNRTQLDLNLYQVKVGELLAVHHVPASSSSSSKSSNKENKVNSSKTFIRCQSIATSSLRKPLTSISSNREDATPL